MPDSWRTIVAGFLTGLLLLSFVSTGATLSDPRDYFKITVVDEETGRGVPLVELKITNDDVPWAGACHVGHRSLSGTRMRKPHDAANAMGITSRGTFCMVVSIKWSTTALISRVSRHTRSCSSAEVPRSRIV